MSMYYNFQMQTSIKDFQLPIFPKKCHLGVQNGSGSSRPEKLPKIVKEIQIRRINQVQNSTPHLQPRQLKHHQARGMQILRILWAELYIRPSKRSMPSKQVYQNASA